MEEPKFLTAENSDWNRDFPSERYSFLQRFFTQRPKFLTNFQETAILNVLSRQAQFIDTNIYYPIGSIDPDKIGVYSDVMAIQAGIGTRMASTLEDQVNIANALGKKYFTWHIPDPASPATMTEQMQEYFSWPGVSKASMCEDVEKPRSTTRHVNKAELRDCVLEIKRLSTKRQWQYSRVNILEEIFGSAGFEDWMDEVFQWIAQYLYIPGLGRIAKYFEEFFEYYSWMYPPAVSKSYLYKISKWLNLVKAWQISSNLDAIKYVSYPWGKKSADGNVSIEPYETFMSYFQDQTPPPPVGNADYVITLFDNQALRTEPSTAGGNSTIIIRLSQGTVLKVVPDIDEISIYVPGPALPKDAWLHVTVVSDGVEGWVALSHPTRPNELFLQTYFGS